MDRFLADPAALGQSAEESPATSKGTTCRNGATGGGLGQSAWSLRHECLEWDATAVPLERLETSDRHRLGLLLQGCALLSHLERSGAHLSQGFRGAAVCGAGKLRVVGVAAGRSPALPQAELRELVGLLFRCGERLSGRGEARRVVRRLLDDWRQDLEPAVPSLAVEGILREAPFLWQAPFAVHRRALAAESVSESAPAVWLVGPAELRRSALEGVTRLEEAWGWLEASDGGAPAAKAESASSRGAKPPRGAVARLELASEELARGRFEGALELLRDQHGVEARLLRLDCQVQLGRLGAAKRTLRQLLAGDLRPEQRIETAELAVRVHGNLGERDHARDWVARALEAGRGPLRARARVVAALESWDRGDQGAMARHLAEAERRGGVESERGLLHARGLLAVLQGRPGLAADLVAKALAVERRCLPRHVAGRLWNDLVLARVLDGDLAGAERACRHCLRLLSRCEGPVKTTLALYNLAEVRLRRGRFAGVEEILERCQRENSLSGNVRGAAQDAELWARFELALGRPREAVERCRAALDRLRTDGVDWNSVELELLLCRAFGWLGRTQEAAQILETLPSQRVLALLEPEERPALYALAGLLDAAQRVLADTAAGGLFRSVFHGQSPEPAAWDAADRLEPYRGARLVFDLHLLAPELVPEARRRWAVAALRRAGASGLAVRLESATGGVWQALERVLETPDDEAEALARLFEVAGHPGVRLECRQGPEGECRTVLAGAGGPERIELEGRAGSWRLEVARGDAMAGILLRLVDRLAAPPSHRRASVSVVPRSPSKARSGLLGESPALLQAIDRLARLARLDLPVLVLGETGTGKELAARHVHAASGRCERQLLVLNCAALSETLVLSDLFGHARGAFTGADRDRPGVFESAEGGTVFLDEIGDLPLPAQGMLLRVLQDGEVRRLGETKVRRVDVRIVAATHRDLERMIGESRFREDLYYRLRVGRVTMPPLRDRGNDVLLLAEAILEELGGLRATREARAALLRHPWPGNVRQLRAVLEAASAMVDTSSVVVDWEHLDLPVGGTQERAPWHEWLDQLKRERLRTELEACGGNQAEVGRRLGLTRQALSYLTRQLGLAGTIRGA
ncbi:MAG TPA: sigma 54-interacting transcriptional regulator [Thermoanaerobaculia bacterium]|nr:sigma 54-interacting transcriptional regulator [Thermoanaerobaculia bacterium]